MRRFSDVPGGGHDADEPERAPPARGSPEDILQRLTAYVEATGAGPPAPPAVDRARLPPVNDDLLPAPKKKKKRRWRR